MKLHDFILRNMELILQAWEDFARDVDTPLPAMDVEGLRNHAEHILRTVVADMQTSQTDQQQIDKAHGRDDLRPDDGPARTHAMTRLTAGFTMDQMVSEYRALRSSVLRLWVAEPSSSEPQQVQQMIRFNEAIDQALVESISTYGRAVEATRKTVLGVLGHDLRTPLGAITLASGLLKNADYLHARENKLSQQIHVSVERANTMVNNLLDLARCNLGKGIPICLENVCLNEISQSIVEELRTAFPRANIDYVADDPVEGLFDPMRIAQAFANLIGNAIRHGSKKHPVRVRLSATGERAVFSVQNHGEVIPPDVIPRLCELGERHSSFAQGDRGPSAGLGLGLFIASQIILSHEGEITVESTPANGTCFYASIPHRQSANTD